MANSPVVSRFLKYVTFDTGAVEGADTVPSSEGQLVFGRFLAEELHRVGLSDVSCDDHAYVMATLPSNAGLDVPTIALIAHLDTAVEVTGAGVKPRVFKYEGGDVILDALKGLRMEERKFPELSRFRGQKIIVTDGNTLLGADDKAGIAAIIEAVKWHVDNPGERHGTVKVVFTPDEEIGHGASLLDLQTLGADFAYTFDGGDVGELCWETFNAARATVKTTGRSIHPGTAKGKMKNALLLLMEYLEKLPATERPENTEGREGFYHVTEIAGDVEMALAKLLVRDHDRKKFEERKKLLGTIASQIEAFHGRGSCSVSIRDQYYNMADKLSNTMYVVEYAREAMRRSDVEPMEKPVRGGTDGSALSWRGLPTPNIFAGGLNAHGRYEFLPVRSLEKSYEVARRLIGVIAEHGQR